jgi:hypothetical protein
MYTLRRLASSLGRGEDKELKRLLPPKVSKWKHLAGGTLLDLQLQVSLADLLESGVILLQKQAMKENNHDKKRSEPK